MVDLVKVLAVVVDLFVDFFVGFLVLFGCFLLLVLVLDFFVDLFLLRKKKIIMILEENIFINNVNFMSFVIISEGISFKFCFIVYVKKNIFVVLL